MERNKIKEEITRKATDLAKDLKDNGFEYSIVISDPLAKIDGEKILTMMHAAEDSLLKPLVDLAHKLF